MSWLAEISFGRPMNGQRNTQRKSWKKKSQMSTPPTNWKQKKEEEIQS